MGTNVRQGIVTNGLTLHLDIANPLCYPGSGTTVTSLLRNGVTGSISGSVNIGYSTATGNKAIFWNNGGINRTTGDITLNSDPFNIGNNPFTIEMLFYNSSYSTSAALSLATNANGSVSNLAGYFIFHLVGTGTPSETGFQFINSLGNRMFSAAPIPVGQWIHVVMTVARGAGNTTILYINGTVTNTSTDPGNISNTVGTSAIGRIGPSPYQNLNGHMAITRFYNRALSAAEVLQNYNAVKSRFGLS